MNRIGPNQSRRSRSRSRLRSRSHSPLVRNLESYDRGDKINRWGPSGARGLGPDGKGLFRKSQPGRGLRKPAFDSKRLSTFEKVSFFRSLFCLIWFGVYRKLSSVAQ